MGSYPFFTWLCIPPGAEDSEGTSFQFLLVLPALPGPCFQWFESQLCCASQWLKYQLCFLPITPLPTFQTPALPSHAVSALLSILVRHHPSGPYLSCGALPAVIWAGAIGGTLRVASTNPTRLLFQSSTLWHHHFSHIALPVRKVLTASTLLISSYQLSLFALSNFQHLRNEFSLLKVFCL